MKFDYEKMSDEELVELAAGGDRYADDVIMMRYKNLVRKIAGAYYLAGGDHDDVIQEGMIGLFKAIRDFDITKQPVFSGFADLCIRRNMISAVKSYGRKKHEFLNNSMSLSGPEYDDERRAMSQILPIEENMDPEYMILQREYEEQLSEEIAKKLSKLERTVMAKHLSGMTYQEIAKEMGRSPKSVDNALQRIKRKIGNLKSDKE